MKILLTIVLVLCTLPLPAKVTLQQAIENAFALSQGLQNQDLDRRSATLNREIAEAQRKMTLGLNASYRFTSSRVELLASDFPIKTGPAAPPGTVLIAGSEESYDAKLMATQPIYSGGLLTSSIRLAQLKELSQSEMLQVKRLEIAGQVKAAYCNYIMLLNKRRTLMALQEQLAIHHRRLEQFLKEEMAAKADVLETAAALEETNLNLDDLNLSLASADISFQVLCGYALDALATAPPEHVPDNEAARVFLHDQHPLLRIYTGRIEQAEMQKKIAAAAVKPQLSAIGELHYAKPGINMFKNEWTAYVLAAFNFSIPLWEWGKSRREQQAIEYTRQKIANERAEWLKDADKAVQQLYAQKLTTEQKRARLDVLIANAEEQVSIKQKMYDDHLLANLDVLTAFKTREKYQSLKHECEAQLELINVSINTIIGNIVEAK